ncbi:hypothetical protein MN116_001865 [Schistosoma mekongi]|uniref:Uncharacterized protein n=1 Tax=Schistosoma mekongi TaxID=38744 RepID=A0AAE1ZIJ5_SCHME|nr:hypothetical protein MN116_001865 [Schistosoma mekongi]
MLPIPPSSVKGPPSWSSLKRRSWLYPNCLDNMRDNFTESYPMKTNRSDQHEPILLPNCFSDSHIQPIKMLKLKTSNLTNNQFPLILYNINMLKENYASILSDHVYFNKKFNNQLKLPSINSIQLLQLSNQYSILSLKNINTINNKLLTLNEIELLKQFNVKINKNKKIQYPIKLNLIKKQFNVKINKNKKIQYPIKLNLIKKHFMFNNKNVIKEKFNKPYQLLIINKNANNQLLQLPLNNNNNNSDKINNPLHNDYVTLKNEFNVLNCQETIDDKSLLTYPLHNNVECNLKDQPTLNKVTWILETTEDNNTSLSVNNNNNNNNNSQDKFYSSLKNEEKSYHDIGVQYNFVDYGEPNTQVDLNAFTNYENVICAPDLVDQLLCNDIGHVTKQFLSLHTSNLINWNNNDNDKVICTSLDNRIFDYNEQNNCNVKQVDIQSSTINETIDPLKIDYNQTSYKSMPKISTSIPIIISSENKSELIFDPVTAKKLQYSNIKNQQNKLSINNEVKSSIISFNKQESNCIPLNVVKALNEIDNRLNVIDQVSIQLEQDHKRNQELLETIIQLNKNQNQINTSFQLNDLKTVQPISQQQNQNILNELNVKSNLVYTKEPSDNKTSNSTHIQAHDYIAVKQKNEPPQLKQRLYSTLGHYSEEREKIRKERREASLTRRCNEVRKFVSEILSESNLPVQSSPILDQPNIVRPSTAPLRKGRSQTHGRGTFKVLTLRNVPKNYTTPFNSKPPTPARSATNGRSGVITRGTSNISASKRQQVKNAQKPSVVTDKHPDSSKQLTYEEDLQTTILSDWSLESDVKRLLYGNEEDRFYSPSKAQSINEVSHCDQESQIPQSPHSIPETDLFTEIGGVPSTSFIDWDEIDELIGEM